jgi:hypothetical protein
MLFSIRFLQILESRSFTRFSLPAVRPFKFVVSSSSHTAARDILPNGRNSKEWDIRWELRRRNPLRVDRVLNWCVLYISIFFLLRSRAITPQQMQLGLPHRAFLRLMDPPAVRGTRSAKKMRPPPLARQEVQQLAERKHINLHSTSDRGSSSPHWL